MVGLNCLGEVGYGATNSIIINHLLDFSNGTQSIESLDIAAKLYSTSIQADIGFASKYFDCGFKVNRFNAIRELHGNLYGHSKSILKPENNANEGKCYLV